MHTRPHVWPLPEHSGQIGRGISASVNSRLVLPTMRQRIRAPFMASKRERSYFATPRTIILPKQSGILRLLLSCLGDHVGYEENEPTATARRARVCRLPRRHGGQYRYGRRVRYFGRDEGISAAGGGASALRGRALEMNSGQAPRGGARMGEELGELGTEAILPGHRVNQFRVPIRVQRKATDVLIPAEDPHRKGRSAADRALSRQGAAGHGAARGASGRAFGRAHGRP